MLVTLFIKNEISKQILIKELFELENILYQNCVPLLISMMYFRFEENDSM